VARQFPADAECDDEGEDGTVIFEAKDRAYDPIETEEFL